MKKVIILLVCSFAFSGTVWLTMDAGDPEGDLKLTSEGVTLLDESGDLDSGSMSIGYTQDITSLGNGIDLALGFSYMVSEWEVDILDLEGGFMSLFLKSSYGVGDGVAFWGQFGIGMPTGDFDDGDMGWQYGLGLDYSLDGGITIGLGYLMDSWSEEGDLGELLYGVSSPEDYEMDWEVSRMVLSVGYAL